MKIVMAALIALGLVIAPKALVIKGFDPGGQIGTYLMWWERVADSGMEVAIEGSCNSACVLVVTIPPERVCVNDNASFGLHMAASQDQQTGELIPDRETTDIMVATWYPKWLQDWIKANGKDGKLQEEMLYVDSVELLKHYKRCPEG